jgi:hypothetical protein
MSLPYRTSQSTSSPPSSDDKTTIITSIHEADMAGMLLSTESLKRNNETSETKPQNKKPDPQPPTPPKNHYPIHDSENIPAGQRETHARPSFGFPPPSCARVATRSRVTSGSRAAARPGQARSRHVVVAAKETPKKKYDEGPPATETNVTPPSIFLLEEVLCQSGLEGSSRGGDSWGNYDGAGACLPS